jgi:hypothetical protein
VVWSDHQPEGKIPQGLEIEVLVTREQNADGMVTISCRALALRQSWDKVKQLEKEGRVSQVKVTGFNRGGVTCDLEGLTRLSSPVRNCRTVKTMKPWWAKPWVWPSSRSILKRENWSFLRREQPLPLGSQN